MPEVARGGPNSIVSQTQELTVDNTLRYHNFQSKFSLEIDSRGCLRGRLSAC